MKRNYCILFLLFGLIICTISPSSLYAQEDKKIVISLSKASTLGSIYVSITNTDIDALEKMITISTDNTQNKEYNIYKILDSVFAINIVDPKLNEEYTLKFTNDVNVPDNLLDKSFVWSISKNSEVLRTPFPFAPIADTEFKIHIILNDSNGRNLDYNVDPSLFSVKAYKPNSNEEADGVITLRKVERHWSGYILTMAYNKSGTIDAQFTVDGVILEPRLPISILSSIDDYPNNRLPQWWVHGGLSSSVPNPSERSSLTVIWNQAFDLYGVKEYHVKLNETIVSTVSADVYSSNASVNQYTSTITGLSPATEYRISVEAENTLGLLSQDNPNFLYLTPGEDRSVTRLTQMGNVLGEIYLEVMGVSSDDITKGMKIYTEENGEKKYMDYTFTLGDNAVWILMNNAQVMKDYNVQISDPLTSREGIQTKVKWNLSSEKSKVYAETVPLNAKVNQDFTFVVFLHDGGEGHSVINAKQQNFSLTPYKSGTDEKATGSLGIKKVALGDNLDSDAAITAEEKATYYVTASYPNPETIDIQVSIDGVILKDKLKSVKIESVATTPPVPNGFFFAPPSNVEETKNGAVLKIEGATKEDWKSAYNLLKINNSQLIMIHTSDRVAIPLDSLLYGKSIKENSRIQIEDTSGTITLNLKDLDKKWIEETLATNSDSTIQIGFTSTKPIDSPNILKSAPTALVQLKDGDKLSKIVWPVTPQITLDENVADATLAYKTVDEQWKFVPSVIIPSDQKTIIEPKYPTSEQLYLVKQQISFVDTKGHWAQSDISWLASRYIINGYEDGSFQPDQKITRAEFASILTQILGPKQSNNGNTLSFADVNANEWYTESIHLLSNLGIVNGDEKGNFYPNINITREEMAVMIERAISSEITDRTPSGEVKVTDLDKVSAWAVHSVQFLLENHIIQGTDQNEFKPNELATRGEVAAIIKRVLEKQ